MIYEIKQNEKIYIVDDLQTINQQTKDFQAAFNGVEKENGMGVQIASFDNANATLYTESKRILISLKEIEDENN